MCHSNAATHKEMVIVIPCWQRSLPGCGFGVVVDIVYSPMWQNPLLPAAQTDRQTERECTELISLIQSLRGLF